MCLQKNVRLAVCLALLVCILTGCSRQDDAASRSFTAKNGILTYERVDPSRTPLVVSNTGNNVNLSVFLRAFEEANPDIQVILLDITGGDRFYQPVVDWVKNGDLPDVMFMNRTSMGNDALVVEYFEDLSGNPNTSRFFTEALNALAIDGHVYFLPSPSEISAMLYNKTLFEQYGWQVPVTFDDFVALCGQITADTNGEVQPWNPNAKYISVFLPVLEGFVYQELFSSVDDRMWYNAFRVGQETFAGHMEPFFDMAQTLIDEGILRQEHFTYSATTRGEEFLSGRIAMINAPISHMSSEVYEFDFMPYPCTEGDLGYVSNVVNTALCVPKAERSEQTQAAIDRFLAYFSSVEGQQAIIGDTLMVSNVKDVPVNESYSTNAIADVVAKGHLFGAVEFYAYSGVKGLDIHSCLQEMACGESTGADIIAAVDAEPITAPPAQSEPVEQIAEITEDFTVLETSCLYADMYRETAGADIGLIADGVAFRGNLVRLYAGPIRADQLTPIKPRSFINGSKLIKVSMTGAQILDAMNHPLDYSGLTADCAYAVSGLRCEIAPWNVLGTKYQSVQLANGDELDANALYTVALWEGTVVDSCITDVLETYEGTWEELMAAYMRGKGALAPAKDGRIKLVWP